MILIRHDVVMLADGYRASAGTGKVIVARVTVTQIRDNGMHDNRRNIGPIDRILRALLGSMLAMVGFYYTDIISNTPLNLVVGSFGLMNLLASTAAICPAYLLTGFWSNCPSSKNGQPLPSSQTSSIQNEDDRKSFQSLKHKLLLSIAVPMIGLLLLFAFVLIEVAGRSSDKENTLRRSTAIVRALPLIRAEALAASTNSLPAVPVLETAELEISVEPTTMEAIAILAVHNNQGQTIKSLYQHGNFNTFMSTAIKHNISVSDTSAKHLVSQSNHVQSVDPQALAPAQSPRQTLVGDFQIEGQKYSFSSHAISGTETWVTAITQRSDKAALMMGIFDPKFLIIGLIVLWAGIWTSTYVIRKFIQKTAESALQLEFRNSHDPLTGLPNRSALEHKLRSIMADAGKQGEGVAFMMIDLIGFRDINDTMGYELGDELLIEIANGLRALDEPGMQIISMGGDVFGLLCPSTHDRTSACGIANRVHDSLEAHTELNKVPLSLHGRIGMSFYPTDSLDTPELIRLADIALAQAKSARLSTCHYQHEKDAHSIRKLSLLARLRTAIENDELSLVYQPKVNIQNNSLVGVEALLRWTDSEYGPVSPFEFVHWAEKSGLINKLTRWVLQTTNLQSGEWKSMGLHIPIAANLSPMNLHDPELPILVKQLVTSGHLGDGLLELELTENAVMEDPIMAQDTMMKLHDMGVYFAIDDFGTGLSSFTYLRKFPVSHLKIDQTFVMDQDNCDRDEVLLRSMIDLGHSLKCCVTAEGVEDELTLQKLRNANCDYVQGYHICKPKPADDLIRWVRTGDWKPQQRAA